MVLIEPRSSCHTGSGSGRSGSSDVIQTKLTWARIAARCGAPLWTQPLCWPSSGKIGEERVVAQRKGYTSKYDYPTVENQAESSIYEAIFLISIDDSCWQEMGTMEKWRSIPSNRRALTKKGDNSLLFLSLSESTAEIVKREPHSFHMFSHITMTCKHGHCNWYDVATNQAIGWYAFYPYCVLSCCCHIANATLDIMHKRLNSIVITHWNDANWSPAAGNFLFFRVVIYRKP